jgi:UDP-N-acetyl-D-mannosaminuronate dehydrogenase
LSGKKVVILGAAYRGGVKEIAFSGVFPIADGLKLKGADVFVNDPLYTNEELTSLGFKPYTRGEVTSIAIIHTDHSEYKSWSYKDMPNVELMLDGRNLVDARNWLEGCKLLKIGIG